MRYSIDTSSLINPWWKLYPPDVFPSVWEQLADLIEESSIRATEEVKNELQHQEDELYKWANARIGFFVEIDDSMQQEVRRILADPRHQKLTDTLRGRSSADPFVIALALLNDSAVVTEEQRSNKPDKPKIPDVCDALNIRVINFLELIRENNWTF